MTRPRLHAPTRLVTAAAAVTVALGMTTIATASASPDAAGAPAAGAVAPVAVTVTGRVHQPLALTLADLRALPRHSMTVTFQTSSGAQTHSYAGPLLHDVVEKAEPVVRASVKNDLLRDYVSATAGSDGYQAVVAWGEIDPSYEGKQVLLAQNEDGTPLTATQLVLVVPGDTAGGRYVHGVTQLRLDRATATSG